MVLGSNDSAIGSSRASSSSSLPLPPPLELLLPVGRGTSCGMSVEAGLADWPSWVSDLGEEEPQSVEPHDEEDAGLEAVSVLDMVLACSDVAGGAGSSEDDAPKSVRN